MNPPTRVQLYRSGPTSPTAKQHSSKKNKQLGGTCKYNNHRETHPPIPPSSYRWNFVRRNAPMPPRSGGPWEGTFRASGMYIYDSQVFARVILHFPVVDIGVIYNFTYGVIKSCLRKLYSTFVIFQIDFDVHPRISVFELISNHLVNLDLIMSLHGFSSIFAFFVWGGHGDVECVTAFFSVSPQAVDPLHILHITIQPNHK